MADNSPNHKSGQKTGSVSVAETPGAPKAPAEKEVEPLVATLVPLLGEEMAEQAIDALELASRRFAGTQHAGCLVFDKPYGRFMRLTPQAKNDDAKPDRPTP